MCMLCEHTIERGTHARARVHTLRLLALLEHPEALHPSQVLRLARQLLTALGESEPLRCEALAPGAGITRRSIAA